jgi:hypothetical protein
MWVGVRLNAITGQWMIIAEHTLLAECRARSESSSIDDSPTYFFSNELSHARVDADRIIDEVVAANRGRIIRVTVGLNLAMLKRDDTLSGCPGNCFCVIQDGHRRCETYYCNGAICWWVPCGVGC